MTTPDFEKLYPFELHEDGETRLGLSPRQAYVIAAQLSWCIDMNEDDDYRDELPPIARRQNVEWLQRYKQAYIDVRARVEAGAGLFAECTGEEWVIHQITRPLDDLLGDDWFQIPEDLPLYDEDAPGWPRDVLENSLEDYDVLMLADPRFDGIKDSDVAREFGMANLMPDQWFLPFR